MDGYYAARTGLMSGLLPVPCRYGKKEKNDKKHTKDLVNSKKSSTFARFFRSPRLTAVG